MRVGRTRSSHDTSGPVCSAGVVLASHWSVIPCASRDRARCGTHSVKTGRWSVSARFEGRGSSRRVAENAGPLHHRSVGPSSLPSILVVGRGPEQFGPSGDVEG
jgi:hypothetical protein